MAAILQKLREDKGATGDVTFRVPLEITRDNLVPVDAAPPASPAVDIKANKFVPASRCERFAAMFRSNMREAKPGTIVEIKDVDAATFEKLLRYLYLDEVDENEDERILLDLRAVAERYMLRDLETRCVRLLMKAIACDLDAAISILVYAMVKTPYVDCAYHEADLVHFAASQLGYCANAALDLHAYNWPLSLESAVAILSCDGLRRIMISCMEEDFVVFLIRYANLIAGGQEEDRDSDDDADDAAESAERDDDSTYGASDALLALLPFMRLGNTHPPRLAQMLSDEALPHNVRTQLVQARTTSQPIGLVTREMLGRRRDVMDFCNQLPKGVVSSATDPDSGETVTSVIRTESCDAWPTITKRVQAVFHGLVTGESGTVPLLSVGEKLTVKIPGSPFSDMTALRALLVFQQRQLGGMGLRLTVAGCGGGKDGSIVQADFNWPHLIAREKETALVVTPGNCCAHCGTGTASAPATSSSATSSLSPLASGCAAIPLAKDVTITADVIWRVHLDCEEVVADAPSAEPTAASSGSYPSSAAARIMLPARASDGGSGGGSTAGAGNGAGSGAASSDVSEAQYRYTLTVYADLTPVVGPFTLPASHRVKGIFLDALPHSLASGGAAGGGAVSTLEPTDIDILHDCVEFEMVARG